MEFKVVACPMTGILLHLEIQKGRDAMRQAAYSVELGGTAGCVVCLVEKSKCENNDPDQGRQELYLGDSWFASVACTVELWRHYSVQFLGVVKTNHARFPKEFIETTMKNWLAGSHIVLEGSASEGVDLLSVEYKYNSRKVLCFVSTSNVGSTITSSFYKARWLDNNGNTMSRRIPCPDIMSTYFQYSNTIDKHNHACQFLLQFEKHWVTEDGYFRIMTMLFGMVITDCWKGYKFHLGNRHRHKNIAIDAFADLLCHDLLRNQLSDVTAEEAMLVIPGTPPHCTLPTDGKWAAAPVLPTVQVVACDNAAVSSLTDSKASKLELLLHELTKMEENEIHSDPTDKSYLRTKQK